MSIVFGNNKYFNSQEFLIHLLTCVNQQKSKIFLHLINFFQGRIE